MDEETYRPYQKSAVLVAPLFHLLVRPCLSFLSPFLACFSKYRWLVTYPMEFRLLPNFIPSPIGIPYVRDLNFITIGELFLVVPLVWLMFVGYHYSFIRVDVEESGNLSAYAIYITFLTATKTNNLISIALGIPFERLIPIHYLSSFVAIALGCFHTFVAFEYGATGGSSDSGDEDGSTFSAIGTEPNLVRFMLDGTNNLTGTILIASMVASVLLSVFPYRRFLFVLWLYSHIILAVVTIAACIFHGASAIIFFAIWWALDTAVRYLYMGGWRYNCKANLEYASAGKDGRKGGIAKITFPKPEGFEYMPGQYIQIAVPALSWLEYHPVSISSSPNEENVTVHFRGLGDWTDKLCKLAKKKKRAQIMFEGPYGSVGLDIENENRYKMVLCVAGGVGVTHIESVAKGLLHEKERNGRELNHLRYVWAVRSPDMIQAIPPLGGEERQYSKGMDVTALGVSDEMGLAAKSPANQVQVEIYCTRGEVDEELSGSLPSYVETFNARPDFDEIFEEMKDLAGRTGETNIAVVGCGPDKMLYALKEACRRHSGQPLGCGQIVFFDIHTETFDF